MNPSIRLPVPLILLPPHTYDNIHSNMFFLSWFSESSFYSTLLPTPLLHAGMLQGSVWRALLVSFCILSQWDVIIYMVIISYVDLARTQLSTLEFRIQCGLSMRRSTLMCPSQQRGCSSQRPHCTPRSTWPEVTSIDPLPYDRIFRIHMWVPCMITLSDTQRSVTLPVFATTKVHPRSALCSASPQLPLWPSLHRKFSPFLSGIPHSSQGWFGFQSFTHVVPMSWDTLHQHRCKFPDNSLADMEIHVTVLRTIPIGK